MKLILFALLTTLTCGPVSAQVSAPAASCKTPDEISQSVKSEFFVEQAIEVYRTVDREMGASERATVRNACDRYNSGALAAEEFDKARYDQERAVYVQETSLIIKRVVDRMVGTGLVPEGVHAATEAGVQIGVVMNSNDFYCRHPFVVVIQKKSANVDPRLVENVTITPGQQGSLVVRTTTANRSSSDTSHYPKRSYVLDSENLQKDPDAHKTLSSTYSELRSKELCQ